MTPYALRNERWEVPDFQFQEFSPKRARYCLCVPVVNESDRIRAQLAAMKSFAAKVDIVIADGGSTDDSLVPSHLRDCGVRTLLVKTGAGRLSAQMRMALAYGVEQEYEGFIFIDGNNKDDPAAVDAFIAKLDEGFDHVQGSRFIAGGQAINTPVVRYVAIRLIHAPLLSLGAGYRYTDTTNGFRAYSARLITDPRVQPFRNVFSEYELHYYLAVRAARLGFRITEVPVTRAYPAQGKPPTKIHPIKGSRNILLSVMNACAGSWDPET